MLFSPVLRAELPLLWAPRFHSPRTFGSIARSLPPTVAAHLKVSDVFEISRVRRSSVYGRFLGGWISSCVSYTVGARASGPHRAQALESLKVMRGGAPRSNLQTLACIPG